MTVSRCALIDAGQPRPVDRRSQVLDMIWQIIGVATH
jgi:hypothetical protein